MLNIITQRPIIGSTSDRFTIIGTKMIRAVAVLTTAIFSGILYAVMSLFDGVSSVVPILKQKFGYPPIAAVLAESNIRELVCTEFGHRSDETWGYTSDGTAVLYLKDVHSLIDQECKLLRELVVAFSDCKWIIVGGSPCQDLTVAGPFRGLLGLTGPSSRLFFVLLCAISAMEELVGPSAVRYLVENAASMLRIHFDAFCELLGLPSDQYEGYVWDRHSYGYQVTRKRNFFRNYDDAEEIEQPIPVFDHRFGPLVDKNGQALPFAPLLRIREVLSYWILRASWTLYQPHAPVWGYSFWQGRLNFGRLSKVGANKIPNICWEWVIPPRLSQALEEISSGPSEPQCSWS